MSASASRTISPSSFSSTRSTPCVLGWCGPMLSSIHSVGGSCSGPTGSWATSVSTTDGVGLQPFEFLVAEDHRLPEGDIVLAQRKSLPTLRHEDPPQIGVTVEADPEQVPGLALVPVRGRPDRGEARNVRVGHGRSGLDPDPGLVGQRAHLPDDGKAGIAGRPVDRRGVEKVVEALFLLEVARDLDDGTGGHHNAQVTAKLGAFLQRLLEALAKTLHEWRGRANRHPAGLPSLHDGPAIRPTA